MKFNIIASIVVVSCMVGSYFLFSPANQENGNQPQVQQTQPQNTNSGKSFNF